jgi:hypothetical protein
MTMYRIILCFAVSFAFLPAVRAEFTITADPASGVVITEDGKPVLQYNHKIVPLPEGYSEKIKGNAYLEKYAVPRSDYIHPFYDLDGEPITKDYSLDHAHHRGIYWAWPEVGYKGELGDLHALQKVFARPKGNTGCTAEGGKAFFVAENVWMWNDKEPIADEKVTVTVFKKTAEGRKINLVVEITPLVDGVTLARRGMKGYGGLNLRFLNLPDWKAGAFVSPEKPETNPAWTWGSWKNPKSEGNTELTLFEKASNPNYPGEFIEFKNLNWFQPAFPKSGTRYPLVKGEALTLRFQFWLHDASVSEDAKKAAWKEYQNEQL